MDPRLYQIATLASLLVYGMGWLDFDITVARAALLLPTVLATQAVGDRLTAPALATAEERAHLRAVALPAAADQSTRAGAPGRR